MSGRARAERETPLGMFDLPYLELPALPDGPDEMLMEMAELEAALDRERQELEDSGGGRRCRYCRGHVSPDEDAGVHEECLPAVLPEGARSCTGCGELILDADDEFEHDFCERPCDEADERADDAATLPPFEESDDAPTEPMPPPGKPEAASSESTSDLLRASGLSLPASALDYEDSVLCSCSRWLPLRIAAPPRAVERNLVTSITVSCSCRVTITVTYSWRRGCVCRVRFDRSSIELN